MDNAIRQVSGTPHRIRTDLSATLFLAGPDEYDGGCLLYTSDAADERSSVDLGGRRIIKQKKKEKKCLLWRHK